MAVLLSDSQGPAAQPMDATLHPAGPGPVDSSTDASRAADTQGLTPEEHQQVVAKAAEQGLTLLGSAAGPRGAHGPGRQWELVCSSCHRTRVSSTAKINEGRLSCSCRRKKTGPKRGSIVRGNTGVLLKPFDVEHTVSDCARLYKVSQGAIRQRLRHRKQNVNGAGAMDDAWVVFGARRKHRLSALRDAHKNAAANPTVHAVRMANELPFLLKEMEREFEAMRRNVIARVLNPFFERHGAGAIPMDWVPKPEPQPQLQPVERRFDELTWDETLKTLDAENQAKVLAMLEVLPSFPLDDVILNDTPFCGWTIRQFRAMWTVKNEEWTEIEGCGIVGREVHLDWLLTGHGVWWEPDTGKIIDSKTGKELGKCDAKHHPYGPLPQPTQ